MVVLDTHLARGASNGGFTFHDRGGPYGRTKGAKRVVAVDVTGLPVAALVIPASIHENRASDLLLEHLTQQGIAGRLELALTGCIVCRSARSQPHEPVQVSQLRSDRGREDRASWNATLLWRRPQSVSVECCVEK